MNPEWVSSNGVTHTYQKGYPCFTCGKNHDPVDIMAEEIANGLIDESEGDLELAIMIASKIKNVLEGMNKPRHSPYFPDVNERTFMYEYRYQKLSSSVDLWRVMPSDSRRDNND